MDPLVTIITPSYNQAQYLESTIQSVLLQDYPAVEFFVIDGGSTDGSLDIIQRYHERLAGWVSEPDRGQAEAINKGFRRASGEMVAWLNSDDLYLPGAIRRGVAALQADPELGFVFGDALTIDPHGCPLNRLTFGSWGLDEILRFRIICQPAVFIRRAVLENVGGLDHTFHTMLDHHLWLRLAQAAPCAYIGGSGSFLPLAAARHHPTAKNVAQPEKFAEETMRLLEWIEAQPNLAKQIEGSRRQVRGGAYRLAARYLLDGGRYLQALGDYARAGRAWPVYTARHIHRMAYAAAGLAGLAPLIDRLRAPSVTRSRKALAAELRQTPFPTVDGENQTLEGWPGIRLHF